MNCRAIEPLLLAERDGVLTNDQQASLERHVAECVSCQQLRARLNAALDAFKSDTARVVVPDAKAEWLLLRAQLQGTAKRTKAPRRVAPVIWFGTTLAAAAAAFAIVFYSGNRPQPAMALVPATAPIIAQAEYVEAGDKAASTVVYVDKDSGWLVVWAADGAPKHG